MTNKEYEKAVLELTQRWIDSKQESSEAKGLEIDDFYLYVNIDYTQTMGSRKKKFFVYDVEAKAVIVDVE